MATTGLKPTNDYIKLTDRELIDLACSGEQIAFTILFERYHYGVLSHIRGEESQDICQETFNKAFRNITSYNSKYEFSTWLYNIAKNTAIDYIRRHKRVVEAIDNQEDKQSSPEEKLIGLQEVEKVLAAIEQLPQIYRDVIYLHGVQEFAYEEIAKKLNISLSTVKVRLLRAKRKLAKLIE